MATINIYKYPIPYTDTNDLEAISLGVEIDNVTFPSIDMSSVNYFSVEGRSLSVSFFGNDNINTELLTNKQHNINSTYTDLLKIYVEVIEGDVQFAGVLSTTFGYDDYTGKFSDVVINDGLKCFIDYHIADMPEIEIKEPFYANIYEPDLGSGGDASYGDEISDIDGLSQMGSSNSTKYYYLLINGILSGHYLNTELFIEKLNVPQYYEIFPMRFQGLDDIDIQPDVNSYIEVNEDSIAKIQKTWFPRNEGTKDMEIADIYANNGLLFDNFTNGFPHQQPIIQNEVGSDIVNPEFYFYKREMWMKVYATIFDNGYVAVRNSQTIIPEPNEVGSEIVMKEVWYIHYSKLLVPVKYSVSSYNSNGFDATKYYDKERVNIIKIRFWVEDETMWYDRSVQYERSSSKGYENASAYYRNRSMNANIEGNHSVNNGSNNVVFYRLLDKMFNGFLNTYYYYLTYPLAIPNYNSIFNTTAIYNYNVYGSGVSLLFNSISYNNKITKIYGRTVLNNRAMLLNSNATLQTLLKASLTISNLSMISDKNGDIRFITKLKTVIDPSVSTFNLDDGTTRSEMKVSLPKSVDDSFSTIFFYSDPIKNVTIYYYKNVFANFIGERKFVSSVFVFGTEPTINDIIVFRNGNYWINSVQLSDDYYEYTIKAYEVL